MKGHLAAYFDADTDDGTMTNYANVIVYQLSVGMENDVFVDDKAKLLMYTPPTEIPILLGAEDEQNQDMIMNTSPSEGLSSPAGGKERPSSSNLGYILVGVGCVVASVFLLLFVHMRRRRKSRSLAVAEVSENSSHNEGTIDVTEDRGTNDGESYCVEVEISDTETVSMSVGMDGHVDKVQDKNKELAKVDSQGTAATEDDCATISTQESGVTLYLDMKRVGSDVSALTWYGPPQSNTSNDPSSGLGRGLAALGMGAIQEDVEEEEDELEFDLQLDLSGEDDIEASVASKNYSRTEVSTEKDSLCYSSSKDSKMKNNVIV